MPLADVYKRQGVGSALKALFKTFSPVQHPVTAGLEAAIFAVPGLGVDDLAAAFTLDSVHTGVTAVSYTHLDVYKRQTLRLGSPFGGAGAGAPERAFTPPQRNWKKDVKKC